MPRLGIGPAGIDIEQIVGSSACTLMTGGILATEEMLHALGDHLGSYLLG